MKYSLYIVANIVKQNNIFDFWCHSSLQVCNQQDRDAGLLIRQVFKKLFVVFIVVVVELGNDFCQNVY
jgi:hypothetical protein